MMPTNKEIKRVAFFGDALAKENEEDFKLAWETAKLLAEKGLIIVNGGGPGIMWAATKGAKAGGGRVELVVLNPDKEPGNYEGTFSKNITEADRIIETNNYEQRLNKLVRLADAFVIFKGGTGTLSEVGLTWELAKFEAGHHEPLVFVGKEWGKIIPLLEKMMNYDKNEKQVVTVVEKPAEVIKALKLVEN